MSGSKIPLTLPDPMTDAYMENIGAKQWGYETVFPVDEIKIWVEFEDGSVATYISQGGFKPHLQSVKWPQGNISGFTSETVAINSGEVIASEPTPDDYYDRAHRLIRRIPGINDRVDYPCSCEKWRTSTVYQMIQHLNDHHHPAAKHSDTWTRERIADWLDTLDADLTVHDEPTPCTCASCTRLGSFPAAIDSITKAVEDVKNASLVAGAAFGKAKAAMEMFDKAMVSIDEVEADWFTEDHSSEDVQIPKFVTVTIHKLNTVNIDTAKLLGGKPQGQKEET